MSDRKMRILFLNGPCARKFARTGRWQATARGASLWYPIWLAHAAALARARGFEIRLWDAPAAGWDLGETLRRAREWKPDLAVIDTSTASIHADLETARGLKEILGSTGVVCLVGPHASAVPEDVAGRPGVDAVAIGEYDVTVCELAERLRAGVPEPGRVPGLLWNSGGYIISNIQRPLIPDLDLLPFASDILLEQLDPAWYGLDFCLHPYMTIMTARGCPSHCTFCLWPQTLTRGTYRVRSLDHVFAEIERVLARRPRIRELFFDDDTFTVNPARLEEFADRYHALPHRVPFSVNARAVPLPENVFRKLVRAGLRCVVVGFESGNQAILDAVRKGTRLEEMVRFAEQCDALGVQVHGDFVLGLPGETPATIEQTVRFATRLPLSTFQLAIAHPLPGTAFFDWLNHNGYLITRDFSQWIDSDGNQQAVIRYPGLGPGEMKTAVATSLRDYYLSPAFLARACRNVLRQPGELRRYVRGGLRFFRLVLGA
ncbi:MAG TPA: radical SAM protein [Candidatus Ozemobacteraceae bacterium]|nr:radical SAM protein [Candidatus Ozemobacteraceae bacterium]